MASGIFEDLTGTTFGRLVVVGINSRNPVKWLCKCECGNECVVSTANLKKGNTQSCGCLRKELSRNRNLKDISGQRFGRLIAIERTSYTSVSGGSIWLCQCDCGNICKVTINCLTNGNIKSCGCLQNDCRHINTKTHGESKTRLYTIWRNMKGRCNGTSGVQDLEHYKNRNITVCDEWAGENGYLNFKKWALGNGYSDILSIDRINNNGDYTPENCRWATPKEQANNRRTNIIVDNGMTLTEYCEKYNLNYKLVVSRLYKGQDFHTAIIGAENQVIK